MLEEQILALVRLKQRDPYHPVWGELFFLLYQVKKDAEKRKKTVKLYEVEGLDLLYLPEKKRFFLKAQGVSFFLTIEELTTAILDQRFLPKA
jgi:hypothetical protein